MTADRPRFEGALPPTVPAAGLGLRGATAVAPDPVPPPARERDRRPAAGRLRTWTAVALVVVAVVVGLAARSALAPTGSSAAGSAADRTVPDALPAAPTTYGVPFTYADGLTVEVGAPVPFTPSRTASGGTGAAAALVEVTVTNGTDESYRASTVEATAAVDGAPAAPVWDPDQGVELSGPAFAVPPGGTVQFRVGFEAADPERLRLTLVPALYGYEALVIGSL
ncbi:hypothetical protein ACFUMH_08915 [Cellulomonas sp. NPDC057328]|uniref:hypothetical protein n=1 Tax=Cellulomonas sp. NPDC057328 TaxID=3346101 RepID=UPI00363A02A5